MTTRTNLESTAPGVLSVDLSAIAANYHLLKQQVGADCAIGGVVKADGYGLGMLRVAPVLEREGCRQFFTATLNEAIQLRAVTKQSIAVLAGFVSGAEDEYKQYSLQPVLNSPDDLERWRKNYKQIPAILHFDTGMNRLGLGTRETDVFLEHPDPSGIVMIMSHFACADEPGHPLTREQAQRFEMIARHFPNAKKSLANSAGIFCDSAYHYDLVRPGMAMYGLNPLTDRPNPMRRTVTLTTRILQVRAALKDESVGYGATHRFAKDTRVGTVALGYADGFLRSGSGRATLYYRGRPCPIIGRVSMDLVTIDLGEIDAQQGDDIEVLGPHQDADTLATACGTIGYEILTSLGRRWARTYIG